MDESKGGLTWIDHINPHYKIWPALVAVAFNGGMPWLVVPSQSAIGAVFTPAPKRSPPLSPDGAPPPTARNQRHHRSGGSPENESSPHPTSGLHAPPPIRPSPPPAPVAQPFWPTHSYSPPPQPLPPPLPKQSPDWLSAAPHRPTDAADLDDALRSSAERLNSMFDLEPTH
eukprot:5642232-Prymnesium_polylepis.1